MKKIFVLMMAFIMMAGLFAYEPKKECFSVYRNNIYYYEKIEDDGDNLIYNSKMRYITFKFSDLNKAAMKYYNKLVWFRNTVEDFTKQKDILSFKTSGERKLYIEIDHMIEKYINTAINDIPFVTRKNFYKITEKKYKKMFIKYMKSIKK